ncbi:MAG: hypothetical protein WBC93_13050 [Sulfitobacter sp.]
MEKTSSGPIFEWLVWSGAGLSLIGLIGLIWCIVRVMRARKAKLSEDEMRTVLQGVLPMNLGALFLSIFGLMLVVAGVLLG